MGRRKPLGPAPSEWDGKHVLPGVNDRPSNMASLYFVVKVESEERDLWLFFSHGEIVQRIRQFNVQLSITLLQSNTNAPTASPFIARSPGPS